MGDVGQLNACSLCRQPISKPTLRRLADELVQPAKNANRHLTRYGTKLEKVAQKLLEIRREDPTAKVIVFVQFEDLKAKVFDALLEFKVPAVELKGDALQRAEILRDWQQNPFSDTFVLLLSLAESASGTNLTAAHHVMFLHPMLASTQRRAVAQELQAIGRVRRYGQKHSSVHVWRFVTCETVEEA